LTLPCPLSDSELEGTRRQAWRSTEHRQPLLPRPRPSAGRYGPNRNVFPGDLNTGQRVGKLLPPRRRL